MQAWRSFHFENASVSEDEISVQICNAHDGGSPLKTIPEDINDEEPDAEDLRGNINMDDLEGAELHEARTEIYHQEHAQLLQDGWIVVKDVDGPSFCAGARVETWRKKNWKNGEIIERSEDGAKWIVEFDDGSKETLAHQALKLLVDATESEAWNWKIIEESEPKDGTDIQEYCHVGIIIGFDFNSAFAPDKVSKDNPNYAKPYLKLFQHMWPGDWKQQLRQLNSSINAENKLNKRLNNKNQRAVKPVTPHKWWKFIGILIGASAEDRSGHHLWEKDKHHTKEPSQSWLTLVLMGGMSCLSTDFET